ncbi:unnamed protein product [Phytophthora lilii]|uniref:Unnamed protein product n=1 Tax=Phytophthora lilii TaxID=2077276 RepID=A0A9W6WGM4_9STRA|nr:unnamed protein product [Phytophthora lilii]
MQVGAGSCSLDCSFDARGLTAFLSVKFDGPGPRATRNTSRSEQHKQSAKRQPSSNQNVGQAVVTETAHVETQVEASTPSSDVVELASHPLVQQLKTHLNDLEVGLERLRQENELLRTELEQCQDSKKEQKNVATSKEDTNNNVAEKDQEQLRICVAALHQQTKVVEARYQHHEEKARAKAALYKESTTRLEEMSTQLFDAQQQIAVQAEKLHVYSDQSAEIDDLQQELHLLRSENVKLNEAIVTLSSRSFDALSKDLQKKNLWIAQLEEERRVLEEDRAKFQQDCIATRRTNDQLRRRVETMRAEVNDLANQLSRANADCEQKAMEKEVAQLQLRFYTSPDDYGLMSAVGKALKEMKKQEVKDAHTDVELEQNCSSQKLSIQLS